MSVEIFLPPMLQVMAGNVKQVTCTGNTVGNCLNDLIEKYPQIERKLFSRNGKLANGVNVFLNGVNVLPEALSTPALDGDKIHVSFLVLGG